MLSEPRTISLVAEFIYMPTTHSAEKLREVYSEVCRTCGYENFTRIQGGARIEARETDGAGFSQLNVMADRVQLIEDHTGSSVEQFGKKLSRRCRSCYRRSTFLSYSFSRTRFG